MNHSMRASNCVMCLIGAVVFVGGNVAVPQEMIAAKTQLTPSSTVTLSAAVAKPLKSAQQAIRKSKWKTALQELAKADEADDKTPRDTYTIDTLRGYVFYKQSNYAKAAPIYERLIASPFMSPAESLEHMRAVANMYFQMSDYAKTIKWSKRYLELKSGQDPEVMALLASAYFRQKDHKHAIPTMRSAIAESERAGRKPPQAWLRIVSNACFEIKDEPCVETTLKQLVRHYQNPEDWQGFLERAVRDVRDEDVQFGFSELMFDLGVLEDPHDYEEAIFKALAAGMPAKAKRMLERGKAAMMAGDFPPGHYERLMEKIEDEMVASKAQLSELERHAVRGLNGNDAVLLGRKYLSNEKYDRAIDWFRRGIAIGGVDDLNDTRIRLGIAYLKHGQKQRAAREFSAVAQDSKWRELAEIWALRSNSGGRDA